MVMLGAMGMLPDMFSRDENNFEVIHQDFCG
jgi:hypothetical protein